MSGSLRPEDQYAERVRDWAEATVEVTTALHRLCRDGCTEAEFAGKDDLRTRLSAQIDKGRWLFPNAIAEPHVLRHEAAFRGIRQPVLESLVAVYNATANLTATSRIDAGPAVLEAHRAFVSEVMIALDPASTKKRFDDFQQRYRTLCGNVDGW